MPLLPAGEYRPDISDYEASTSKNILNVLPRGDGYGPFPDFAILSQTLIGACRGAFYALKSDGSVAVFAGTSDRLWIADNTDVIAVVAVELVLPDIRNEAGAFLGIKQQAAI